MGLCVSINNDMCLRFKCKSRKSGSSGCFITLSDISNAMNPIVNIERPSISSSSLSSNKPNKLDLYDYLFNNRDFLIFNGDANMDVNTRMKTLNKKSKKILLDDFFNNNIGFKIFYTKEDFIKEVSDLNIIKSNCKEYIEDYTTLYNINNNFAFILNKYKTKSDKKNNRGITITFRNTTLNNYKVNNDDNIYIITYKNCKSSLKNLLVKDKKQTIENFNVSHFMENISPIMKALHKSNYAHMDLKPANIVYCNTDYLCNNKTPCFKIIDFSVFDLNKYNINDITIKEFRELLSKLDKTDDDKLLIKNIFSFQYTPYFLLPDIISFRNETLSEMYAKIRNTLFYSLFKDTEHIPKDLYLYLIDNNKLSYLFKKSDEYAIALTLNEIRLKKYDITNKIDETFIPYIVNLLNTELYFENLD